MGWVQYESMLSQKLDTKKSMKKMKEVLHNPELDAMLRDKMTGEQQETIGELKHIIYEANKNKK